jgi:hypothetical protein
MLQTPKVFFLAALVALAVLSQTHAFDKKKKEPTREEMKLAEKIGKGHSYDKHVVKERQFPKVKDQQAFIDLIAEVLANPTHSKKLERGREAFYDQPQNILVIVDPRSRDKGTCFRPSAKKRYYDNLK